jgi:hypothetical protein
VTKFSEEATPNASVGVRLEKRFTRMRPRLHVSRMESGQREMLAAARPPWVTSDEPRESEVAIARATIHLIRAYELLEALDRRAACLATLPRFGDLDYAIRNVCAALIVLADEGGGYDHGTMPYP